jgi:hypothetical protein
MSGSDLALPVLSRGKHRNPRKGACFMEFASYLAGERWSDHPACTHPLLASVARHVNDFSTDAGRSRLAPLVPSVIGLNGDDPRIEPRVALRCIRLALPVVAQDRQHVLAVALLRCEQVLAEFDGKPAGTVTPESRAALAAVPQAERWARHFISTAGRGARPFKGRTAERAVSCAVQGVAEACIPDPDGLLRELLDAAIAECRRLTVQPVAPQPVTPQPVVPQRSAALA